MYEISLDLQHRPLEESREAPWPVSLADLRTLAQRLVHLIVDWSGSNNRPMVLAGPAIMAQSMILLETAWLIDAAKERGGRVVGGAAEAEWLRGKAQTLPRFGLRHPVTTQHPVVRRIREMARTASWTRADRMPGVILGPQVMAVNHNLLMRQEARRSQKRIRYKDSASLLLKARHGGRGNAEAAPADPDQEAVDFATAVLAMLPWRGPAADRLHALLAGNVSALLGRARQDLAALESVEFACDELWSGTGGNYAARALGLEMRRRGGRVRRFDHGGSTGMLAMGEPVALGECVGADVFTCFTPAHAKICRDGPLGDISRSWSGAEFEAGNGDPHIAAILRNSRKRPRPARPRVMLVTGALVGLRQVVPPVPRDPIYLDWHMRLARKLISLPFEIVFKPHPEGALRGQRHPFNDLGQTLADPFEKCVQDVNAIVFDFPLSTTFWAAMCTEKPVVLVDIGLAPLASVANEMVRDRCYVVHGEWRADGRPDIDTDILGDALIQAMRSEPDASAFRSVYLGTREELP